ncbi:MAG: endonuclease/exonuclease/phosphatase family protein [Verrucomicrobiae bacterium]|nr:endonuclease/exonuclease/phosphatase family protein [Verrucomicrobiae bacterium]
MAQVARFRAALARPSYDKPAILGLYRALKDYVQVIEVRGKLFSRRGTAVVGVKANGRADWEGWLEFKREEFAEPAIENTAAVLRVVAADVLCLVEVESRPVLERFAKQRLKDLGYDFNMVIDGNDERGIDVGLLSRLPVRRLSSHVHDRHGRSRVFSRDCLEAEILLPGGRSLFLLLNHFKSKCYGTAATNKARRKLQAETVARILTAEYDLQRDLVAVCSDLNDTPDSGPLKPLLGLPHLHDVLAVRFHDVSERWTYCYDRLQQIDYLLVSDPLRAAWRDSGVERRGIFGLEKLTAGKARSFPSVDRSTHAASDHGAVWADFEL